MTTNIRFCLSNDPFKWDFIALKMNLISISKRIVDMVVVNDVVYAPRCYYTCGHTIFMIRRYCIKAVSKAINSRALTSEKPCINMEFHAPFTHRFLTYHMQDSGQYSIDKEEASSLQLKLSIKRFTKSYADSDIVKK